MMRAAALLFDIDGLLVDSEPLWLRVEAEFCAAKGGEWTAALAERCVGQGLANTLRVMAEEMGLAVDVARDTPIIIEAFLGRLRELELKKGARELVAAGKGVLPMALGSSSSMRLVRAVLGRFELEAEFGAIVSGDCVPRPKPAPDIFLKAARDLGVAPGECVVLEDSRAGVMAARAAGMKVIAVPEGDGAEFEEIADAVVPDLVAARERIGV